MTSALLESAWGHRQRCRLTRRQLGAWPGTLRARIRWAAGALSVIGTRLWCDGQALLKPDHVGSRVARRVVIGVWIPSLGLLACGLLVLGALAACKPALLAPPTPTLMPLASAPVSTKTPTPEPSALSPTGRPPPRPTLPPEPEPGMRAADAELLFAAPVPLAADIMEWRPPAVPVPHSLHPNDHYWLRRPIPSGKIDWGLDWYPYGGDGMGVWRVHHGMDFANDPGTPVLAAADGTVVWATESWFPVYVNVPDQGAAEEAIPSDEPSPQPSAPPLEPTTLYETTIEAIFPTAVPYEPAKRSRRVVAPYGNYVVLRHDWGWQGQPVYTLYAHLLEVFVKVGDRVAAGDLIAGVGNSGDSTGPHLHLEVRVGEDDYDYTRNPALWLAPYEGWGTLAGRVTDAKGAFIHNATVAVEPVDSGETSDTEGDTDLRILTTYASDQLNPDDVWQENFVVPDLPAGEYRLIVQADGEILYANFHIRPGVTTFVKLHTE